MRRIGSRLWINRQTRRTDYDVWCNFLFQRCGMMSGDRTASPPSPVIFEKRARIRLSPFPPRRFWGRPVWWRASLRSVGEGRPVGAGRGGCCRKRWGEMRGPSSPDRWRLFFPKISPLGMFKKKRTKRRATAGIRSLFGCRFMRRISYLFSAPISLNFNW